MACIVGILSVLKLAQSNWEIGQHLNRLIRRLGLALGRARKYATVQFLRYLKFRLRTLDHTRAWLDYNLLAAILVLIIVLFAIVA